LPFEIVDNLSLLLLW